MKSTSQNNLKIPTKIAMDTRERSAFIKEIKETSEDEKSEDLLSRRPKSIKLGKWKKHLKMKNLDDLGSKRPKSINNSSP